MSDRSQESSSQAPFAVLQTVEELLDAAARQGLRLTTEQAWLDQTGLDFLVVQARDPGGTPWIVRTPRRADVVDAARREARVLALVRPRLPVAVPHWRVFAPDVIAYPRLEGVPAVTVGVSGPTWNLLDPAAPSPTFLASFGQAMAALQRIDVEEARRAGVVVRSLDEGRQALALAMEQTRAALSPPEALWARWHRWLDDPAGWPQHLALIHGDLHPGHMLLDEDTTLTGILDWTEAQVSDPSIDLAMFVGCFGEAALRTMLASFTQAGGVTWPGLVRHASERWAAFPVLGAEWALRTGNEAMLEHSRAMLAGLVAGG